MKTRLTPPLGPQAAADLYAAFVGDLMETLESAGAQGSLFLDDPAHAPSAAGWPDWPVVPQVAGDLGARLAAAALHLSPGPRLLVGADHPNLPAYLVTGAFEALADHDLVIGPAIDGGYYLIGERAAHPALFADMPWSQPELLAATLARAEALSLKVATLPIWYDVDDAQDLALLKSHLALQRAAGEVECPRTARALGLRDA